MEPDFPHDAITELRTGEADPPQVRDDEPAEVEERD